jgi:membrane protease YdiL (CAAX protease family)
MPDDDIAVKPLNAGETQSEGNIMWGFGDVIAVASFVVLGFAAAAVIYFLLGQGSTPLNTARLIAGVAMGFVPIVWLARRRHLNINVLGWHRGRISVGASIAVGVAVAIVYSFITHVVFLGAHFETVRKAALFPPVRYPILMLLTLPGLTNFCIVPFSEEVLFRGFLFGYLRVRIGVPLGLAVQALVFALLHFYTSTAEISSWLQLVLHLMAGIVLGGLYEITGNIISSVICHSVMNYYIYVFALCR